MIIHNPILTGSLSLNGTTLSTGNIVTTGSNTFVGNQTLTGSLNITGSVTATGNITAQTLVVQTITSSVVYSSGSNVFGNVIGNTHQFTGSMSVTGSIGIGTPILSGSLSIAATGGNPLNSPLIALSGNTTSNALGDINITRTGTANYSAGQGPSIQLGNTTDLGYGMIQVTSGSFQFLTYAPSTWTERIRITNAGNVGIGTNDPSGYQLGGKFVVTGATSGFYFNDANNRIILDGAGTNRDLSFYFRYSNSANIESDSYLKFTTGATERMRITSAGNLLINRTTTNNPAATSLLEVGGSQASNGLVRIINAVNQGDVNHGSLMIVNTASYAVGNDASIGFALTNSGATNYDPRASIGAKTTGNLGARLVFNTRNESTYTEKMTITQDGNVGIGTNNPLSLLHSRPANNSNAPSLGSGAGPFFVSSANQLYGLYAGTSADGHSWLQNTRNDAAAVAYPIALNPNGGYVGIGMTSPTAQLEVVSSGTGVGAIQARLPNGATAAIVQSSSVTAGSTSWYAYVAQSGNGSAVTANTMFVYGNGNLVNLNNSYGALSDAKLKENITDATPKLADIMQLKVRNFNFIADDNKTKQIGFIAQEMEEIFPGLIEETPDKDMEHNDLGTITKTIKTSVLVPMLVKAIQELNTKFEDYKATHP